MPMIRPTALRSLQSSLRYSGARATARAAPARTQLVARRYASSGGHGGAHGESSSDLPWILGALIITPPSCYYLWPDTSHAEHHGDHGHDEHEKSDEGEQSKEDEEPQEEAAPAEQQSEEEKPAEAEESKDTSDEKKEESKDEEPAKDSEEKAEDKSEDKTEDKPEEKSDEGEAKEQTEDRTNAQGKGKMAEDSAGQENTRKLESDSSKGATKKRLDSGLGKNLGEGSSSYEGDREANKAGGISQKQKGMSNTDTRHSIQIDAPGSEKSTKGSGGPETAKHKGTVDTSGPLK